MSREGAQAVWEGGGMAKGLVLLPPGSPETSEGFSPASVFPWSTFRTSPGLPGTLPRRGAAQWTFPDPASGIPAVFGQL